MTELHAGILGGKTALVTGAGRGLGRVFAETLARLGCIDVLVHNAGGDIAAAGGKPDPNDAVRIKDEDVRVILDRNLLSTILVSQRVARKMMPRRTGRIVTISSIAAFAGRDNSVIYATGETDSCGRLKRSGTLSSGNLQHRPRQYPPKNEPDPDLGTVTE